MLNYQTDSDDEMNSSDDDDLGVNLEKQKREMIGDGKDAAWGKSKKTYYKGDSDSDDGSSAEEDLANEALRLQKIRQQKLAKQFEKQQDSEEEDEGDE